MQDFARANGFKLSYETNEKEEKSRFIGPDGKLTKVSIILIFDHLSRNSSIYNKREK